MTNIEEQPDENTNKGHVFSIYFEEQLLNTYDLFDVTNWPEVQAEKLSKEIQDRIVEGTISIPLSDFMYLDFKYRDKATKEIKTGRAAIVYKENK